MSKPLVSIITPTYNHEKYISECIESVLSQTYPHWEMIIIDDGSTDRTPEIVRRYVESDDRIHYLRQKNKGIWSLRKTYNRALKFADGELIAILEGDDFWPDHKLELQIGAFKDPDVVLSWGKAGIVNEDGSLRAVWDISEDLITSDHNHIFQQLIFRDFIPAVTVMIRKEALLSIGGFKQPLNLPYVDYPTWLELATIGKFRPVNHILGYWRRHESQATVKYFETMTVKARVYALYFFRSLPTNIKQAIKISEMDIFKHGLSVDYLNLGKFELNLNKFENAKDCFMIARDFASFRIELVATLFLIYAQLRKYYYRIFSSH
ncbi:glycosyltransferase [Thermococcus sp. 21S7]|uniref:glycosyltransferase family 2 protein n=1 Tax=Thermococcus sp. 21S7 TaxID=1638221 RepID=UPI001F0DAB31|nr:glycosyltransferase [Thermococcus sp. 21S7]